MAKNNLEKRIALIEENVNPRLKILYVVTQDGDQSREAAIKRVLKEQGLSEVPEGCTVYLVNLHQLLEVSTSVIDD